MHRFIGKCWDDATDVWFAQKSSLYLHDAAQTQPNCAFFVGEGSSVHFSVSDWSHSPASSRYYQLSYTSWRPPPQGWNGVVLGAPPCSGVVFVWSLRVLCGMYYVLILKPSDWVCNSILHYRVEKENVWGCSHFERIRTTIYKYVIIIMGTYFATIIIIVHTCITLFDCIPHISSLLMRVFVYGSEGLCCPNNVLYLFATF